ncbi:hypothetical protein KKE34_01260, partial [Patescibacteria group bacterium]|nr:hypothetical protein [Patescibacteria group bacterium]
MSSPDQLSEHRWPWRFLRKEPQAQAKELSPAEVVDRVNALKNEIAALNSEALRHKTHDFRLRLAKAALQAGEGQKSKGQKGEGQKGEGQKTKERQKKAQEQVLKKILPEAFAVVREVSKRTLGLCHYDEQLHCGLVLHRGCVAEMKTGEGKTLAATLPTYLNALSLNSVWVERATQEWGSDLDQWKF